MLERVAYFGDPTELSAAVILELLISTTLIIVPILNNHLISNMTFSVVIPYQFYNLVMVFVTILALLWGMVAVKRFYRMLRIRSAVLTDRIIQIRGMGSYLTYFDGATRTHMDAVVHTRQSMPPVSMAALPVTAVSKNAFLVGYKGEGRFEISIEVSVLCRTKVIVLINFNSENFQKMNLSQGATEHTNSSVQPHSRQFFSLTGLRDEQVSTGSYSFPRFQRDECCSFECLCTEVQEGHHTVKLSLLHIMNSWIGDNLRESRSGEHAITDKLSFAVMLVPAEDGRTNSPPTTVIAAGNRRGGARRVETGESVSMYNTSGDEEEEGSGSAQDQQLANGNTARGGLQFFRPAGRNPMTSEGIFSSESNATSPNRSGFAKLASSPVQELGGGAPQAAGAMFASVFMYSFNMAGLRTAATAPSEDSSVASSGRRLGVSPNQWMLPADGTEVLVLDRSGHLFTSQEVFGLAHPKTAEAPRPSELTLAQSAQQPQREQGAAQDETPEAAAGAPGLGGCFVAEDCVVCLTVPKQVLLLPCR
mgnify:CR=1 FL=1